MAYRNKTYVCFDGDTDMHFYRLMQAWHQNDNSPFNLNDAHDLNRARDSSMEESIKEQLRERLASTKALVVLIGDRTRYLHKFVRWEMEQALRLGISIVGVNLNGLRHRDDERCPPVIKDELVVYVSFRPRILQHALETWPEESTRLRQSGKTGPFYFDQATYDRYGITG